MVLTKQNEMEAKKVYLDFMQSYMTYDVSGYDSFLDDDFHFVGSAVAEEFLTRKESTDFFEETGEQINGKIELRNRMITTQIIGSQILVGETNDAYVLYEDEWIFYGRFRVSCLLRKNGDSWKLFHLHISNPDTKAQEGDTIGTEQIAAENLQLRDAVKRRTVELEQKNRELEIEASLERVRARAMAMQKSDELSDLVDTVFKELTKLDFALSWCIINIIDESSLSNMVWAANPNIDKAPDSYHMKFEDYPFHDAMMKGYKQRAIKFIYVLEGNEKKVYDEYLFKDTEFRKVPEEAQAASRAMEKYVCSFTFSNFGGLQTVGEEPLSDANLDILARFGKVFDLTYTRFNDLKQAEAQAREAQIEAALERVRSRSMAMHNSEELKEVVARLFEGLDELGFDATVCNVSLINRENNTTDVWTAHRTKQGMSSYHVFVPSLEHPFYKELLDTFYKNKDFAVHELYGREKKNYIKELLNKVDYSQAPEAVRGANKELAHSDEQIVLSAATMKYGLLVASRSIPLTTDEAGILQRFAKVFEQTYTRFTDLKKAEAQAREAQIETALERVRSRTMGMQKSGELGDVATILFMELNKLVENLWTCGFVLCEKDRAEDEWWLSTEDGFIPAFYLPNTGDATHANIYNAWKKGETYHTEQLDGRALQEHYDWLMNIPVSRKIFEEMKAAGIERPNWQKLHCAFFSSGYLVMITRVPCPEETIFKRFAQVFDQTYTRFLDLQKAEAQARESEIELALERVRARTMAMQKSEELKEVIQLVYEQFVQLDIFIEHAGFIMDYKTRDDMHIWLADRSEVPSEVTIPYFDCAHWNSFNEAKEKGMDFFANHLTFEEKNKFYKDLFKLIPGVPEETKEFYQSCPGLAISTVLLENVGLYIENFSGIPYSDEENETLMRFGKVFQQTYTRFNDLQRAEEQNKIIQAENERKTQELEEARQLQIAMLPKELPQLPNLDIAVYMQTATEVGGDYYDFHVSEDGTLTAVLGDATGHGMKAGTVVTITKSLFKNLAPEENILDSFSKISGVIKDMKFRQLSMCLMMLKIKGNDLSISSAAVPPALIYRKRNQTIEEILLKGMPLGAMNNFPYTLKESYLEPGDTILLLSDGLPELLNESEEMYGYYRTKAEFCSVGEKEPEEIVNYLKNSASQWTNGKAPDDDVTFVVIKMK